MFHHAEFNSREPLVTEGRALSDNGPPASCLLCICMAGRDPEPTCRYLWMRRCSALGLLHASSHALAMLMISILKLAEAESKTFNAALRKTMMKGGGFDEKTQKQQTWML